jgi:hypothetical protein
MFPDVPYSVKPDLTRSLATLVAGDCPPEVRAAKQRELQGSLRADLIGELDGASKGIELLAERLGKHGASLEDLALHCAEDLALLHNGIIVAIAFAFPSGFKPCEKLGLDFAAVHAPVADAEALRAASAGITAAMKRPAANFERGVWTLTSLGTLSQHPAYPRPQARQESDLWFRSEFQVLQSLGGDWTAFSVRVHMEPWSSIAGPERERIKSSLATMSAASRSYKNLHEIAALLGV